MKLIKFLFSVLLVFSLLACLLFGETIPNFASRKYSVKGCDLSRYQGTVDWPVLAEEMDFVFIKATEGSTHVDPCFAFNREESRKTSVCVGYYHFFSFESAGKTQAEHFLLTAGPLSGCLPPAVDVEFYGNLHPDKTTLLENLNAFLLAVEQSIGTKPIIYTTESFYREYLQDHFSDYPLWIRNVYFVPRENWTFWQYADLGQFSFYDGEERHMDLNVFAGKREELNRLLIP